MRDYSNIPTLNWTENDAARKAQAQIMRQEPVILQMPQSFRTDIDGSYFHCELDEQSGVLYGCDGGKLIRELAARNRIPELDRVAEACARSSSLVDLDSSHKRLIVHD
jgi:hypothetical protein